MQRSCGSTGSDNDALVLTWFMSRTEQRLSRLTVPRTAFNAFEREPGWDAPRMAFASVTFVDMERLMSST